MIAIIVAPKDFRDEEYFISLDVLSREEDVVTFSTKKGPIIGAEGGEGDAQKEIKDMSVSEFSAIVFVGGPGCLKFLDNEESYRVLREANCVLGAICISPVILANAGVLKGVRATVWSSDMERSPIRTLKEKGAIHENSSVVIDKRIVTANGPGATKDFAEAVLDLTKKQKEI